MVQQDVAPHSPKSRRWEHIALAGILALALALRLWGIGFGLPHRYHVDEPPQVLAALRLAQGDINIEYPPLSPNLHQILLMFLYGCTYVIYRVLGIVTSPWSFAQIYLHDPSIFYLIARGLSVVCSLASILLLYHLLARARSRAHGIVAAAALAVCFLDVREAHFAKPYTLLVFLLVAAACCSYQYVLDRRWHWLGLASLACGVAIGLRYSMVPTLALPGLAAFVRFRSGPSRAKTALAEAAKICSFGFLGLLLGAPSIILNTTTILANLNVWLGYVTSSEGFEGIRFTHLPTVAFYHLVFETAWGWPAMLMALVGLPVIVFRRSFFHLALVSFSVLYTTAILLAPSASAAFARYALPLMPFVCVCIAEAVVWLHERWRAVWTRWGRAFPAVLVTLVLLIPALRGIRLGTLWQRTDTRTLAKQWIEHNISSGTKVAVQWHTPPLSTPTDREPSSTAEYQVTLLSPFSFDQSLYTIEYYRKEGYANFVTSSFIYELSRVNAEEERVRQSFQAALTTEAELVAEFKPSQEALPFIHEEIWGPFTNLWQRDRPGPTIRIYKLAP